MKNMEEHKLSHSIQATFTQANLKQGEKYTLLYMNDFCFPVASKITLENIENTTYAQYDDAVRMVFRPKGKRNLYQKVFCGSDRRFAVIKGWHDIETARTVSFGGMSFSEISSGDYSFIDNACKDLAASVALDYKYNATVQEVTEAEVVRMVDGHLTSEIYALKDLGNHFEITGMTSDLSEQRKHRIVRRAELDNKPILKGFAGPMWSNGRVRYEDKEAERILSA